MLRDNAQESVKNLATSILDGFFTKKYKDVYKRQVHKDLSERLPVYNRTLYLQVKEILEENKAQRHIRGGLATRRKYKGI